MIWYIILAIVVLIALYAVTTYNRFVYLEENVENAMASISAQIESRWDALRSLIDATKSYAAHEANTLENIVAARSQVSKSSNVEDVEKDNELFTKAMGRLNVVVENYPDLKASTTYLETMKSIDKYENYVRQSRMIFNDTATKFNRLTKQFPSNIVASLFGFSPKEYFKHSQDKSNPPTWN